MGGCIFPIEMPRDVDEFVARLRATLEPAYLAAEEPWRQSGFSGPEARWEALRRPVADCVDRSGSFCDVGCANGYLLECVRRWAGERGVELTLAGLDVSAPLVELARRRLPDAAERLVVANAFDWVPPRRFDYVRTELVYVPADRELEYLGHLLGHYVADGGALLVANYLEGDADAAARALPGSHPTADVVRRLGHLGVTVSDVRDGVDAVKGRKTRVAVVRKS